MKLDAVTATGRALPPSQGYPAPHGGRAVLFALWYAVLRARRALLASLRHPVLSPRRVPLPSLRHPVLSPRRVPLPALRHPVLSPRRVPLPSLRHPVLRARRALLASLRFPALCAVLGGCAHGAEPIKPVPHVDAQRFMGSWYVIASIPTFLERNAYNAVESYELLPDGRIQTTFRYRSKSFEGKVKTMHPIGTIRPNSGNAVWCMQFIWPIKAEYIVADLDDTYSETVIARNKRDYVWIMARTPTIPDSDYDRLVNRVKELGYRTDKLRKVPQRWTEAVQ